MIIVGGENLSDLIEQPTKDGSIIFEAKLGGSPYNCALAIARQGENVGYLTPISTDNFGELLADNLLASNVKLLANRSSNLTSLALVSNQNGKAKYQFYRENTAERDISLAMLNKITPKNATALFVGSLALVQGEDANIWAKYLPQMRGRGLFIALDPNIRAGFIEDKKSYLLRLNKMMKDTDLLKLSDEDLNWLVPNMSLIDGAKSFFKHSKLGLIIVTLGDKGAIALKRNEEIISINAINAKQFKDSIGAGDVFMGSLLAYLAKKDLLSAKSLSEMSQVQIKNMLEYAALAAALNCEKDGCDPPFLKELKLITE